MVERSEFSDHAGLRQDAEILASLDKQRNGTHSIKLSNIEKIMFTGKVIKYNRFGMK